MSRIEKDSIGEIEVPGNVLYGAFTTRASKNFRISGIKASPDFIKALAIIKKACAKTNIKLDMLNETIGDVIIQAADEIIEGKYRDQFILDVFQAGAGTPFNMNMNEVIANIAILKLGGNPGEYSKVHPNNHVNMAQSSNDVIPTTIRLSVLLSLLPMKRELEELIRIFNLKAKEYDHVIKVGRTHLEDAVPIRYGQVFSGYAASLEKCLERLGTSEKSMLELSIGGTAIGTGINTHPNFKNRAISELNNLTGFEFHAGNSIMLSWSMTAFVEVSNALRILAIELNKISNDLRLLNSGPRAGISEIILPEVEPGSSIMPGKINPSIAEAVNMVCFQVAGNDHAVAMAAEAGQLELNVMTPLIAFDLLWSTGLLANTMKMFREDCISGLIVDEKRCNELIENSHALATVLNSYIGYDKVAQLVKTALLENKSLKQVLIENDIIPRKYLDEILDAMKMTEPRIVDKRIINEIRSHGKKDMI
ncbi:MAG: aspartate ammonia-lyase [Candidatus Methanoperedens sp.]|uniref:aspartate ammonia-lyase n=1 Tax=Candidatus Methanoperedens sp. BLZ2 TaxID=2035255 RepID=UPI001C3EB080|nr:aspartate ammonia-lyase [Candidatus Methanoperedens sp. BLZ2]MBZ0177266.1 aspartate ammonia-lyase [Candidatus Methanoperedens nitroreducens]MCX9076854.1 aspartate ammonia-lyase [Candidatus Methanoperedens sp.]